MKTHENEIFSRFTWRSAQELESGNFSQKNPA